MLSAIEKGRLDRIKEIVDVPRYLQTYQAVPQVLNEDLNSTMQVTPLARAVWRGDFETVSLIVQVTITRSSIVRSRCQ